MPEIEVKLLQTQKRAYLDTTHKWIMYLGGLGSGKSWLLVFMAGVLSWANSKRGGSGKDLAGGLMTPSLPEFKKDVLPLFMDMYGDMVGFEYKANGKHGSYFKFPWNSKPLYIFSAQSQLKGPNLGYFLFNEHSSMPFERIQQGIQRVRGTLGKRPQIWMNGTPEDDFNWLEEFIEKHTENGRLGVYTAPTSENSENLGEDYVADLMATLDPAAQELYLLGKMVRLGGDFFYYAYEPSINDWKGAVYEKGEPVHVSIDFNVGRMTATCWHVYGAGHGKQAVAFDQIELLESGSNTRELGIAIEKKYGLNCILTLDSAAKNRSTSAKKIAGVIQTDAIILKNMGFAEVRWSAANPPMRKRQLQINGLLSKRKIIVHPTNCPALKKDLKKVRQDPLTWEKDKSDPKLTHASDGMDYLMFFEFPFPKDIKKTSFKVGSI